MKNLQIIRRKRKMSQLSLAMKLEVAQETVSAYERGKTYPGVETLLRMLEIFQVSTDYLLDLTEETRTAAQLTQSSLAPAEQELLFLFEQLLPSAQHRVIGYVEGLLDKRK